MKTYYTLNELKRMATLKAMELINKDENLILTNTSYGGTISEVFVGLETLDEKKTYYVGLKGDYMTSKYSFVVAVYQNRETEIIETMFDVYEIRTYKGRIYVTDKEALDKHYSRYGKRSYGQQPIQEYHLSHDDRITKKLLAKISEDTGKKIRNQSLVITSYLDGYRIYYNYRNDKKSYWLSKVGGK